MDPSSKKRNFAIFLSVSASSSRRITLILSAYLLLLSSFNSSRSSFYSIIFPFERFWAIKNKRPNYFYRKYKTVSVIEGMLCAKYESYW
jgi:hypothetical protein